VTVVVPQAVVTDQQLLDAQVPLQRYTFRFEVLDRTGGYLGELAVSRDNPPSISNDSTRPIRRTLDNVEIMPRPTSDRDSLMIFASDVDPLFMQIRVSMVLQTGHQWPLGIFLWADDSEAVDTIGVSRAGQFSDRCVLLEQDLDRTLSFSEVEGITVTGAMEQVAESLGIRDREIEPSNLSFGAPAAWVPGRDTYLTFFESACATVGYLAPYFDNSGTLICRKAPDQSVAEASFIYGKNTRVIKGTILRSTTLLKAPNRYVAVDSGSTDTPIVGLYDVPDEAPQSFARIGRRIVKTVSLQGLESQDQANQAAYAAYISDPSSSVMVNFSTPPDPRHDTFNTVSFDGETLQELKWTMSLKPGADMTHETRQTLTLVT
jgi:hypothetical protein